MGKIDRPELYTARKSLDITYAALSETLNGTPETLPTSEPGTPQISYTASGAALPTLSFPVYQKIQVAVLYGAGKVVTAATISWRMKKNGSSVASGTQAVSANNYYTVCCGFYNIAQDDVLELALWSNQTDSNWDYKAFRVLLTRIIPFDKYRLLSSIIYPLTAMPGLSLGNPSSSTYGIEFQHLDSTFTSTTGGTVTKEAQWILTKGLFRIGLGDVYQNNGGTVRTHASYRPYYYSTPCPTNLAFRGITLR